MNKKHMLAWSFAALLVTSWNSAGLAADTTTPPNAMAQDPAMALAMKNGTPNENHRALDPLAGRWTVKVKGWMKPGDKAQESTGTADHVWVMGGRYLKQDFKGSWAGQPFEGTGYTGYDNIRQEYQTVWLDNMATGMMHVTGSLEPGTKTLKQSGHFACPMTNEKERWIRSDWKINSNDSNTYSSYSKGPDGREYKTMEITYTRIK